MKPILFNTDMVRAILEDRKTATRRAVKEPYYIDDAAISHMSGLVMHRGTNITDGMPYPDQPYHPGDILYVRETWVKVWRNRNEFEYFYKANVHTPDPLPIKWHPSIHMPREAARIFLRVTDVSVHRVQNTTDEGARKEGCENREDFCRVWNDCYAKPRPVKGENGIITHYESFPWENINETRTYRGKPWYVIGNPWVWGIALERISREEEKNTDVSL